MKNLLLVVGAILLGISPTVQAEYSTENKIIKVVIPQASASGLASIYNHVEAYAKKQNINLVPVYKPGANGNIGTEFVARSPADGYTLIVNTLSHNVNPLMNPGVVKYDPVKDFAPIILAAETNA